MFTILETAAYTLLVGATAAVIGAEAANRDGLPSPETLETLKGYNLLGTDVNGWIEIVTDGSRMWVEVERK